MKISHFREDITPPLGHPLCGGWYPPAAAIGERLSANGVILLGDGTDPVVICALDWAELSNLEYMRWREELAAAAGTDPARVVVHCVHNHDSPWPDEEAQDILDQHGLTGVIMDRIWSRAVRKSVAASVARAMAGLEVVDNVRFGAARIRELASNRRPLGQDGKVTGVRWTRCRDSALRALPEGDIDQWLRTASFWRKGRKLVSLHYYAIHPTSYDRTGIVTPDFPGIARDRLIAEEGTPHVYFTGCAGNITAAKYNDGEADNRAFFTGKIYEAMRSSEVAARDASARPLGWRAVAVRLPARVGPSESELLEKIKASFDQPALASRAAFEIAYRQRIETPLAISALHFGKGAVLLHLPGEAFIEYQLYAQSLLPGAWVGTASYCDLGPGYICMERSFEEGGYEPKDSFCAPESEHTLKQAIRAVLL